ncbi:MAG: hypothetical protein ACRDCA_00025 [Serratia sp. (in: enterobacteria)]|uniref:hypothetical protein n=1 Tax=Serratia sp. (in: enterobacteria) TaxID=616 RepID=UPI003F389903
MEKLSKAVPVLRQSPRSIPRQMNITFDNAELQAMNAAQRAKIIMNLANLLLQAADITTTGKEVDDD